MNKPKRAKSKPAAVAQAAEVADAAAHEAANDWSELAHRWQDIVAQWTQLWSDAALGTMRALPVALPPSDLAARVPAVSIDPAAAAQLTPQPM